MLNGNLGTEKRICFVGLCFRSPYFECIAEEADSADIVAEEVNKTRGGYCLLSSGCKLLSVTNMEKKVFN